MPKLVIYSGHDTTVMGLLAAFGAVDAHGKSTPPTGSHIEIELLELVPIGTIPTHDVNSGLIIESNLQTSATSTDIRIGPVSVASLNVTQYKHHVINNTWKFPGNHITANANAGGP